MTAINDIDLSALDDLDLGDEPQATPEAAAPRDPMRMLRRIPVRLTLEVGEATVPLADVFQSSGYNIKAVMRALLSWAARQDVSMIGLQVVEANAPAIALYQRLGFVAHATNRFWVQAG